MVLNSKYIAVSGLTSYAHNSIVLPSGTFGLNIDAHLSSINATFGFNTQPHRFDLEYIPEYFDFTDLPTIGTNVAFTIGENFYIKGDIVHADYNKSEKGNIVSLSIEDDRLDLNKIFLDTYGIFGHDDSPQNNVVDIVYWYVKNYVDTRKTGLSLLQKELYMIFKHGATYRQIYEAVDYFEHTAGTLTDILNKIPQPEIIEAQLIGDPSTYRWQFKSQPLLECINKILSDVCYDFYWDMRNQKIDVINTKHEVLIGASNIPVAGDSASTVSLRYGKDKAEEATQKQLYGAEMEGIIGGGSAYGTDSGAFGLSAATYNLGIGANTTSLTFIPAWRDIVIKYYGPDGFLQEDTPTDREYALSLKGIELWAAEKGIDNRIETSTIIEDTGLTQRQGLLTAPDGRPGLIQNRSISERAWVMEWYNKVRSVAQNYYSRAFKLSISNVLYDHLSQFDVIPAAWCNLENMTASSGLFPDDYKIQAKYNPLAPMWDAENNKLKAFAVFPDTTKWGEDGKATPVQFESWNEIQNTQVVPIEVHQWDKSSHKFSEDFINQIDDYEKGILIVLPNMCWQSYYTIDPQLAANTTLAAVAKKAAGDTNTDFDDPTRLQIPYSSLTDVAIPVRVRRRYGYQYPRVWASGTGSNLAVEVNDDLAPWNFEPRNDSDSVELMDNDARNKLNASIVDRDNVTFAEVSKLGLPIISFDGFANQNHDVRGYGIINHGVTSLSISKGLDWWQTKYNLKSHFPQFLKVKPIDEGAEEDFHFALHRFEEKFIDLIPKDVGFSAPDIFDTRSHKMGDIFTPLEKWDVQVTIYAVYDRGGNEYYLGVDADGNYWPKALTASLFSDNRFSTAARKAFCSDGYLQVGMTAVYHWQDLPDDNFKHWFTGGVPLSAGRVVQLTTTPQLVKGIWTASVKTMTTTVSRPGGGTQVVTPFYFYNVPFMYQQAVDTSLAVDDKLMVASHGNKNNLVPSRDYGPNSTTSNYGDCYLANNSVPSDLWIAQVNTTPNTQTGRGGVIQTIESTGGVIYTDAGTVGNNVYNVYFVGCEYDQIEVGDFCVVKRQRETGGAYRLYCLIQKPQFQGGSAYSG